MIPCPQLRSQQTPSKSSSSTSGKKRLKKPFSDIVRARHDLDNLIFAVIVLAEGRPSM